MTFKSNLLFKKSTGVLSLLLTTLLLSTSCNNETTTVDVMNKHHLPYNPSAPVVIDSFSPESGKVATQMIIHGSNFGTDTAIIKVAIDTVPLHLISSSGNQIYAMVPLNLPSGKVKVEVGKNETLQSATSANAFKYQAEPFVSTLAGFTDKDGKTAIVDGPIDKAQFEEPYWLCFDQDKNIYMLEEYRGMRYIDKDLTHVSTKWRTGRGLDRPRTITFTPDWKTMYVTNDAGNWTDICTAKFTYNDQFKQWETVINSKQCNGGVVHPQDDAYFYNSYEQGQVFKWSGIRETGDRENTKELFKIQDIMWEFNIQFSPTGDFAYIVVRNQHYILKSYYNRETQELEQPILFAGAPKQKGYKDGVGTSARFNEPHQGTFDEKGNFYLCDVHNHVIRKITPDGIVSTFAGRAERWGYTDGALRDAQFDQPHGIIYDTEDKVFYIADQKNRRIRKITMPENETSSEINP